MRALLRVIILCISLVPISAQNVKKKIYIAPLKMLDVKESIRNDIVRYLQGSILKQYRDQYSIMSEGDVQTLLKQGKKGMQLGCKDTFSEVCIRQTAEALDADEIIHGEITQEKGKLKFSLSNLYRDRNSDSMETTIKATVIKQVDEKELEEKIDEITSQLISVGEVAKQKKTTKAEPPKEPETESTFQKVTNYVSDLFSSKDKDVETSPPKEEGKVENKPVKFTAKTYKNSIGMEFILIPAGEFTMGCSPGDSDCSSDEKPAHPVKISKPFYMGKYEVTQAQWKAVMGQDPAELAFKGCADCPVENVSWNDAQEFIKKLNNVPPEGDPSVGRLQAGKYRLPTEAEWEYAARAGSTTKYYFGDDTNKLVEYAWFNDNSFIDKEKKNKGTHQVGQKKPNAFGLYDMLGNVWEWTEDWYDDSYYQKSKTENPKGPNSGFLRVIRGGSWLNYPQLLRVSLRYSLTPGHRGNYLGFRLVLSL